MLARCAVRAALGVLHARRRHLLPARAASAVFWTLVGDGAVVEQDSITHRVRFGDARLNLLLPLGYHQNWSIAIGRMPLQDRVALDAFATASSSARAVFDVGMNAGSYLYTAIGHRGPSTAVVGFEPDERMCAAVRANVQRNSLADVLIETCAVSAESGAARLHRSSSDQMHTLNRAFLQETGSPILGEEHVRTVSIDDFADARGLLPDLIKIDVEGHEREVLAGAVDVLERLRPTLLIEMGRASSDGVLFGELIGRGYRASLLAETAIAVRTVDAYLSTRRPGFENYLFEWPA